MRIDEFERTVFEIEGIVIRIRAPVAEEIGDYDYQRRANDDTSVTGWLSTRITRKLNGLEVSIIDGDFKTPHGRTKLSTLRDSYDR